VVESGENTDARRTIGDIPVHPIALGGMSWSMTDVPAWPEDDKAGRGEEEAIATIHAAVDGGANLIDTARAYTTATHPGHSEALIRRALALHPQGGEVVVGTKGGHYRSGNEFPVCGTATALRRDCDASRALLARDQIDIYYLHWPDPTVGIAASIEALAELREEGWIRHIGVSNVTLGQLEEAREVAPIAGVQNHFSPLEQGDREVVDYCAAHSIAYLSYSPLGGGAHGVGRTALRDAFPGAAGVAEKHGISLQRLVLAWLLTLSPTLIAICGAGRPESIRDSLLAAELSLGAEDLAALDF
jgi:aryl-alcohol dehydrogenase-like predicted oxidoreductase